MDAKEAKIFVNLDNRHILRLFKSGGYGEVGIKRMRNNYLLYTAFYAWTQHVLAHEERFGPI